MPNNQKYRDWDAIGDLEFQLDPLGAAVSQQQRIQAVEERSAWEIARAGFVTENTVISGMLSLAAGGFPEDPNYEPDFDQFDDRYVPYFNSFARVGSKDEEIAMKAKIDYEIEQREIIQNSGWAGFAAAAAGGLIDPINLIPVVGALQKAKQAGTVGRFGYMAAAGATGAATAEIPLQLLQETRTAEESIMAIGTGAVLTGIVGTGGLALMDRLTRDNVVGSLDREVVDTPDIILNDNFEPTDFPPLQQAGDPANAPQAVARGGNILRRLFGAQNTIGEYLSSPTLRILNTRSTRAKELAMNLVEDNIIRVGFEDGSYARPKSAELGRLEWEARLADTYARLEGLTDDSVEYGRETFWKKNKQQLTEQGFTKSQFDDEFERDIVRYLRGQYDDKWVDGATGVELARRQAVRQQASTNLRTYFNDFQQQLQAVGLIDRADPNFVPQVWRADQIYNMPVEFNRAVRLLLERWGVPESQIPDKVAEMRAYLADGANRPDFSRIDDVDEEILGVGEDVRLQLIRMLGDDPVNNIQFSQRTFQIPPDLYEYFEPFLINDPRLLTNIYHSQVAGQLELVKATGSLTLRSQLNDIRAEYGELIDNAETPKEINDLMAERDMVINELKYLRDSLIGNTPQVGRFAGSLMTLNYLSKLGGVTVSSIPDMARLVMAHGLRPYRKMIKSLFTEGGKAFRESRDDMRRMAVGIEIFLSSRSRRFADLDQAYYPLDTKLDRSLNWMQKKFGKITGFDYWNQGIKRVAGLGSQQTLIDDLRAVQNGTASRSVYTHFANMGIPRDQLDRVIETINRTRAVETFDHPTGGIEFIDYSKFTSEEDLEVASMLQNYIMRESMMVINTPTIGALPKKMRTSNFRMIMQFKSFLYASLNQTLIPLMQQRGLNERTMNMYLGASMSVVLGMFVHVAKDFEARVSDGQDADDAWAEATKDIDKIWDPTSEEGRDLWYAGLDRGGVAGWITEGMNLDQKVGIDLIGRVGGINQGAKRYAARGFVETLAGPSAGSVNDLVRVGGKAVGVPLNALDPDGAKEWTASDTRRIRRLLPFQNVTGLRYVFDQIEQAVNEAVGVEE